MKNDVSTWRREVGLIGDIEVFLVVKSTDQIKRRQRLIESKQRNTIGRIKNRPISLGMLVNVNLGVSEVISEDSANFHRTFSEPRGLTTLGDGSYLLAEVGAVHMLNPDASVRKTFDDPWFAFLHSIHKHPIDNLALIVSSGYDAIIEIDYTKWKKTWSWFGWEHGFNPAPDNTYLTRSAEHAARLLRDGKATKLVHPSDYGVIGLTTSFRTTHPSSAMYMPDDPGSIVATLGQAGCLVKISIDSGEVTVLNDELEKLPHHPVPFLDGWMVTNTLAGEIWTFDRYFNRREILDLSALPGKPVAMADHEWVQMATPVTDTIVVAADANRGIVCLDMKNKYFDILNVDENWSIQQIEVVRR